jgi:hypothetical protein
MVWIYLDTEVPNPKTGIPPDATSDFFRGWSDTMLLSQYGGAGGVYGNPLPQQNFVGPYCAAYNTDASMRIGNAPALLWVNQDDICNGASCDPQTLATRRQFTPTLPTCGVPTVIYQYATNLTVAHERNAVDFDLANGIGFASMWSIV